MIMLTLRRTVFLDGEHRPDDHEVRYEGRTVGRILRLRSIGDFTQVHAPLAMRRPHLAAVDPVTVGAVPDQVALPAVPRHRRDHIS